MCLLVFDSYCFVIFDFVLVHMSLLFKDCYCFELWKFLHLFSIKFSFHVNSVFLASRQFKRSLQFWFLFSKSSLVVFLSPSKNYISNSHLRKNYFLNVLPQNTKNYFHISITTWLPLLTVVLTKTTLITMSIKTTKVISL